MGLHTTRKVLIFRTSILLLLFLSACSAGERDVRGKTVASVGGEKITVRDVRELFGVRSAAHRVFGVEREKKREAVERLIAGKLLAAESRNRGYDESGDFQKLYDEGEKDIYIAALFKEKVDKAVMVKDGQIQAEAQKIMKENEKLSQQQAVEKATEKLYNDTFREGDNGLVQSVKGSIKTELHSDEIDRIVGGVDVGDDRVVAEVEGIPVSYGDIKKELSTLPRHGGENLERDPRAISAIVERISVRIGLYDFAKKEEVDKGDTFNKVKGNFESSILIDLMIDNEIRKKINVGDEEVKKTYDEHPEMFEQNPKIRARHILVDDEKTAGEVYEKIQKGADFEDLAKQFSKDPSAAKGGDLGIFGRGVMVKPFEEKAFSLKIGETSKPVKTQFGYHIIQVTEKQKGNMMPFAQVKENLKRYLLDMKMNAEIESLIGELKEKADISINESNLDLV